MMYDWASPVFILLFLALAAGYWWRRQNREKYDPSLRIPLMPFYSRTLSYRARLRSVLQVFFLTGMSLLIIAIMRPRHEYTEEEVKAEGIDIFLVMDLSSSMLARDFDPDRLSVSKEVAAEFVRKRQHDRIGLSLFAGEAFTQSPLTNDHRVIAEYLENLQVGLLEDGTAIGMGMAMAVNRLVDSEAESKVIILLTDGVNNSGYISPETAAELAGEYNIRVYTIGVGSEGRALSPISRDLSGNYMFGMTRVEIDEQLLNQIATTTGGKYYRATTAESLESIYREIDELEKTEMEVTVFKRYDEAFRPWMLWGLGLILAHFLLKNSWLKSIP
ncbi:MAG: VWA domain-containing protein [Saprospiraceae bacterium]|nr:VWA domain-containing protein [Saprospiraceae bacterium]